METEKLALAFGLSYASWIALPRCLMGAMPPDWQDRVAALISEFQEAFPGWGQDAYPSVDMVRGCAWCGGAGFRDEAREDQCAVCEGAGVNISPSFAFLHEYRHPDEAAIAALMFPKGHTPTQAEHDAALERVRHNPALFVGVDLASGPDQTIKHVVSTTEE